MLMRKACSRAMRLPCRRGCKSEISTDGQTDISTGRVVTSSNQDVRYLVAGCAEDEDAHEERDDGDRHLPDDEAAAEGGRAARALLSALVPGRDGDGPAGAERA